VHADEIALKLPKGRAYLADQLHRAALSVVLNIGEGAGEFSKKEKARFYRMALRSGTECAAVLDSCRVLQLANIEDIALGRRELFSVVRMLSRMVLNFRSKKHLGKGKGKGMGKGAEQTASPLTAVASRATRPLGGNS